MGTLHALPARTLPPAAVPSAGRLPASALADRIHLTRVAEILRQAGAGHPSVMRGAALMHFAAALEHMRSGDADHATTAMDSAVALWGRGAA